MNDELILAVINGHGVLVEELIADGADINAANKNGETALMLAVQKGHVAIVKALLVRTDIDVNYDNKYGDNALILAAKNKHSEIVQLLLETINIDVNYVNKNCDTVLFWAVRNDHLEIVQALLASDKIDVNYVNKNGETALMLAVTYNRKEIVALLLAKESIDVNYVNKNGETALMLAVTYNRKEIVALLLAKESIDINYATKYDYTALMLAVTYNKKEMVALLLAKESIDVNAANVNDETALMLAARRGHSRVVKMLLDYGANVNYINKYGDTALILAVQEGHLEIVELLLTKNINTNHKNYEGKTALIYAKEYSHIKIKNILNIFSEIKDCVEVKFKNEVYETLLDSNNDWNFEQLMNLLINFKFKIKEMNDNVGNALNSKIIKNLESLLINNSLLFNIAENQDNEEYHPLLYIIVLKIINNELIKNQETESNSENKKLIQLLEYIVQEWPVDFNYQSNYDGYSAWNLAFLVVLPEIAFIIKKPEALTVADHDFIAKTIKMWKKWGWTKNQVKIIENYLWQLPIKDEVNNTIDQYYPPLELRKNVQEMTTKIIKLEITNIMIHKTIENLQKQKKSFIINFLLQVFSFGCYNKNKKIDEQINIKNHEIQNNSEIISRYVNEKDEFIKNKTSLLSAAAILNINSANNLAVSRINNISSLNLI